MRRKAGIILVGLFTIALVIAGYYIRKDKKVVVIDPWLAVPSDAIFIAETPDFPELLTKITDHNGIISRLSSMKWAADIMTVAGTVDSITGSRDIRELMNGRKVLVSFHSVGQGKILPLFVMNTGPSFTFRHLLQMINKSGAVTSTVRELGGIKSIAATYGRGVDKTTIHITLTSGIIILSTSETLVANALNNKNTGSDIRLQQGFTSIVNASGKETDNLFILFRNMPKFLQAFIVPDEIAPLSSIAIAAGADIASEDDGIFISGFLSTYGAGQGADKIRVVTPAESGVHEVLPKGTLGYTTVMHKPALTGETAMVPSGINATDISLALSAYTGTEITTALLPTDTVPVKAMFFRMTDRQSAETVLKERLTAKYRSMGLKEKQFISSTAKEDKDQITLYKMPFTGVASMLSGKPSESFKDNWVAFCRTYMVFASQPEVLIEICRQSDNDNTLINDPDFREMEKTMPTKGSLFYFVSGRAARLALSQFLTPEAVGAIKENAFSGIDGIGLCLSPSADMIYTSISFRYRDVSVPQTPISTTGSVSTSQGAVTASSSELSILWKTKLDAPLAMKPFFFTNHNTGATEIFVQDTENNIYLLSSAGKILWKAKIRERIRGDVYMIDYYRNNKNQLLFTGKEYIHIIDRNGNYVDRFPVKLKSPASNTLSLFDYENNKEYRLCIAGDDRKIYIYDRSGVPVKGWTLFTTKGKIEDQVAFFRAKGKDYLVAADDQSLYILDRTGNIRVNLREAVVKSKGSDIRLQAGDEPSIVFTSPDGTINKVKFDGSVTRASVRKFTPGHSFDVFDIDNDGMNEYVFIDEGSLYVFDNENEELLTCSFENTDLKGPYKYIFSPSDRKIGLYEQGRQLIYLIGRDGATAKGFPVNGLEYFSAGKLSTRGRWSFVTGDAGGYVINYELDTGI